MKIAIACDHAGFLLKETVTAQIKKHESEIMDFGTDNAATPVDYPDYAAKLAQAVASGKADRGIMLCGSGIGACITANKFKGVRAAACHDTYSAAQGVAHDDMNVLCMGARVIGSSLACSLVDAFLTTSFTKEPRHMRRLEKLKAIENANMK
ncbi:MAG: ribose 5-phosphate isomerase B [Elusimicrobiales bacterium]|nr:ribose 5-phosphate isomerase B [Elusimicrobiales bacterium]